MTEKHAVTFTADEICGIVIAHLKATGRPYPPPDVQADLMMIEGGDSTLTWEVQKKSAPSQLARGG